MGNRILAIDDDFELCRLIKKYLETESYEVVTAYNGNDGLSEAFRHSYLLIILDVMLPGKNGFELLTEIRKNSPVPVMMLTAKDSEIDKVSGLRLGADDYMTKPFSMNEMVARVQSLIRRYTTLNEFRQEGQSNLEIGGLSINAMNREVYIGGKPIELTAKEFDLLYFLASHKGRVYTKKQIYGSVWQDEYAYDDNNIMVHIRRLRKKIEPDAESPTYIQTVWGVGYKFNGEV